VSAPVASWFEPQVSLAPKEFEALRALIAELAGLRMAPEKHAFLAHRLSRRLRATGVTSYGDYVERVKADAEERQAMLEAVTTGETRFFREPAHFELIEKVLAPRWLREAQAGARPKVIRAWSAGCSTGEEPHSLAMTLVGALGDEWDVQVLATDLSRKSLQVAEAGIYEVGAATQVPPALMRFVWRGVGSQVGRLCVVPEVRARVRTLQLNLHDAAYPVSGPFELVFCRNVLIYFEAAARRRVLERMAAVLAPGGHLVLGHAESLAGLSLGLESVIPTVYARAKEAT
jgi:chemotaxis protein methyltransferase CheR